MCTMSTIYIPYNTFRIKLHKPSISSTQYPYINTYTYIKKVWDLKISRSSLSKTQFQIAFPLHLHLNLNKTKVLFLFITISTNTSKFHPNKIAIISTLNPNLTRIHSPLSLFKILFLSPKFPPKISHS